ncbi:DNA N-6-adenine-methyltransferase [Novosphingobium barchaimii]|uniref:DNA N-6-adenine-methyltransferase n=1 Tax=Novosphingobium barchaimii TaxID=1420591 RepID=UPI0011E02B7D|nr:DNA N-6-adenine-methyltransferase [Novosphingobium barchaimii]
MSQDRRRAQHACLWSNIAVQFDFPLAYGQRTRENFRRILMQIGKAIRDARKAAGLSQHQASALAGVSARALWTLEKGGGAIETFHLVTKVLDFRIAGLPRGSSLAQRLRLARKKRRWPQAEVARRANLTAATVRALEAGGGSVASLGAVMSVLAPTARGRKPERAAWAEGSRDERFTPRHFLKLIEDSFGAIAIDPCSHPNSNVVAERHIMIEENGLSTRWSGRLAYVNPPFSAAAAWIERCHQAWLNGEVETVVLLCPARTHIRAYSNFVHGVADTIFLAGRLQFDNAERGAGFPLGLMVAVWGGSKEQIAYLLSRIEGAHVSGKSTRFAGMAEA